MKYLDIEKLRNLDLDDFLAIKPFPYFNSEGVLTESGFQDLLANMPLLEMFDKKFGYERRAGQAPHDRYSLEYTPDMPYPSPGRNLSQNCAPMPTAMKSMSGCWAQKNGVPFPLALHTPWCGCFATL